MSLLRADCRLFSDMLITGLGLGTAGRLVVAPSAASSAAVTAASASVWYGLSRFALRLLPLLSAPAGGVRKFPLPPLRAPRVGELTAARALRRLRACAR